MDHTISDNKMRRRTFTKGAAAAVAGLATQRVADEAKILYRDGIVEPHAVDQRLPIGHRRLLPEQAFHRVTDESKYGKCDERDQQQDDECLQQATQNDEDHGRKTKCGRGSAPRPKIVLLRRSGT